MGGPVPEDEPCEQCGLCCRIFGCGIAPTQANVFVWIEQGRTDILRWFVAIMENGPAIPCTDISPADLGSVVSFESAQSRERRFCHGVSLPAPRGTIAVSLRYPCGKTRDVLHLPAMDLGRDILQPVPCPEKNAITSAGGPSDSRAGYDG